MKGGWGFCRRGVSPKTTHLLPETAAGRGWAQTPSHCVGSSFLWGITPHPQLWPPACFRESRSPAAIWHPCSPSGGAHPAAPPRVRSKPDTPGQRGHPGKAKADLLSWCSQPSPASRTAFILPYSSLLESCGQEWGHSNLTEL